MRCCTLWADSSFNPCMGAKPTGNNCLLCHRCSIMLIYNFVIHMGHLLVSDNQSQGIQRTKVIHLLSTLCLWAVPCLAAMLIDLPFCYRCCQSAGRGQSCQIAWPSPRPTQPAHAARPASDSRKVAGLRQVQFHKANQSPCRSSAQPMRWSGSGCQGQRLGHASLSDPLRCRPAASFNQRLYY